MNLSNRREIRKFVLEFGEGEEIYHIAYITESDQEKINRIEKAVKVNGDDLGEDFLATNDKVMEKVFIRCLVDWEDFKYGPEDKPKIAPCNTKWKKYFFKNLPGRALKIILMARDVRNYVDHGNIEKN